MSWQTQPWELDAITWGSSTHVLGSQGFATHAYDS